MSENRVISILFPGGNDEGFKSISDTAWHDLGMDAICEKLSPKESERTLIAAVMKRMSKDPAICRYRTGVFEDLLKYPDMRKQLQTLLDKVQFLNDYGSFKREHDSRRGLWELLHRLSELHDYILCVEDIQKCLDSYETSSEGLSDLKEYLDRIYRDSFFAELKKDVESLDADTSSLRSLTVGINLNKSFEVDSIGLISVNSKEFKGSGILNNFTNAVLSKNNIKDSNEWNGSMHFNQITGSEFESKLGSFGAFTAALYHPYMARTLASAPEKDATRYLTHFFDKDVSHALGHLVKKLEQVLARYISFSINDIAGLIPELLYYVRWAEYTEGLISKGYKLNPAETMQNDTNVRMNSEGLYNLKLAALAAEEPSDIVLNDIDFTNEHTVYLLTGANRGGKTTITQAIGQLFVMAQGGIRVPAQKFVYAPVDCIYTHFPADEDKTMDLGRLGEECRRFKEIYIDCTKDSLLLLNETFSTTSFEEGYYIAYDAVRALLKKGVRTVYNTHMHKLATQIKVLNDEENTKYNAASLVRFQEPGKEPSGSLWATPRANLMRKILQKNTE